MAGKMVTSQSRAQTTQFERHGLADEQLVWMMRNMLLQRTVDNRGFQLNRQGKIPFAAGSEGHEALQAGAAVAFHNGKDVLAGYYRDLGLFLGIGISAEEALRSQFACASDVSAGRQFPHHFTKRSVGLVTVSSVIAAHCTHAAGIAYAIKYRGEADRAVLCTFGDGATSEGEWHEALNFSAVHHLPIVFLCENNGLAISVPLRMQMAIDNVAERAAGYGMPGETFNGLDPIVSYDAVKRALERARSGGGPSLIEGKVHRYLGHTTDDDDRTYRSAEEVAEMRKRDPIPAFEAFLLTHGVIDQQHLDAMRKEVLHEVNEATDRAEAEPMPLPADLYTNVYEGDASPWR
jgi:2-oxoisovalerate dehydrogenase E1 component alpha subunit